MLTPLKCFSNSPFAILPTERKPLYFSAERDRGVSLRDGACRRRGGLGAGSAVRAGSLGRTAASASSCGPAARPEARWVRGNAQVQGLSRAPPEAG